MKLNKAILVAALTLGLAGLTQAGTVYMTGSTAARSAVYSTLTNDGAVFHPAPTVTLYDGGTTGNNAGNGATYMAFVGNLVGSGTPETIQCYWSGSEAGTADVVSNLNEGFMNVTLDGTDHGTNIPATINEAVNLAMADNAQAYSRSRTPLFSAGHTHEVGVITFEWVRNPGLWNDATSTNVTDSQIRQAMGGYCLRATFDGNFNHTNDYVYVSGRDSGSGTRVNAFGDSGWGIFNPPNQIEMNSSGVMQDLNPPNGVYAGDYGFSSGGTLAKSMGANTTTSPDLWNDETGFSVIAYLGVSDATTATNNGAILMTYDGVPFSATNVENGTYTFWGNEYSDEANNVSSGSDADLVYQLLWPAIGNYADGVKVIALTAMHATRNGPTTDPSHKPE